MIAPIDEKNVCTDWIEGLFDDSDAIYGPCCYIGLIERIPTVIRWRWRDDYFEVLPVIRYDDDFVGVKNRLVDLLAEWDENDQSIGSTLIIEKDKMRINVFWKNEDE